MGSSEEGMGEEFFIPIEEDLSVGYLSPQILTL
jgi:hypothetical protein